MYFDSQTEYDDNLVVTNVFLIFFDRVVYIISIIYVKTKLYICIRDR